MNLLVEWQVFKRVIFEENKVMMDKSSSPPSFKDIKDSMETCYACIFSETCKVMNIFLATGDYPIYHQNLNKDL